MQVNQTKFLIWLFTHFSDIVLDSLLISCHKLVIVSGLCFYKQIYEDRIIYMYVW